MTINTIAANTTPCGAFAPSTPAGLVIPPAAADDDQAPVVVGNIFQALMPDAVRASVPAANDDDADEADDEPGSRNRSAIENAKLRRVMAVRLVRARMLSGLSQGDVSKALGMRGQTQCSLWEMGRRTITHVNLVRLSDVLGVSLDYLMGISDEPERDPSAALRNSCLRGVRKMLDQVAAVTVDEVARHARLVGPHTGHVREVLAAGDALLEAFGSFSRANMAVFESQRGSATLLKRTQDLEASLESARAAIRLHDALDSDLRRALADIAIDDETLIGDND